MNADASEEEVTATATRRSGLATGVLVFAFSLHLMAGYLVLISGLIFPIPAVLGLLALWFVGLYLMVRWRARPGWVLAVPLSLGVIWFATGWVGDTFLGWTA